jgi:DNA repair exonuclease SbcCD nuclease subunit
MPIPPVIHPGSTDRTSFAEKDETKGFFLLEIEGESNPSRIHNIQFIEIPTRPMIRVDLQLIDPKPGLLTTRLKEILGRLQPDSIVQIRINQTFPQSILREISGPNLRRLAPETMNVSISIPKRNWRRPLRSGEDKRNPGD